ncbi:MAG TPA: glycosyltransferase family 4 protein [Acidobacteriaceae bacterium]|nr:glycosyltransferase family 4 protein [Acidobacteriaceae bacterium]
MRVLVLCGGTRVFGLEIMALAVAQGLRSRGHEILAVASGWNDGDYCRRLTDAEIPYELAFFGKISLSPRPLPFRWTIDALRHLPGARRDLRRFVQGFRPDAVIAYNRDSVLQARRVLPSARTIFHVQDLPERSLLTAQSYRAIDRSTAAMIAISNHIAGRLRDMGITASKISVIHNGVGIASLAERRIAVSGRPPHIVMVGQIGDWKGHDDLMEALRLLRERGLSFRCTIVGLGEESYTNRLKQKSEEYAIADAITWRGYLTDRDAIYADADVVTVPSRFAEPFGLVAAEAGARGIPVIATRRGGLPEIVVDGVTGFLIDPEAPDQLAERLAVLLKDEYLRDRLGASGRKRAHEKFSVTRMIDAIELLCTRVAARAGGAAPGYSAGATVHRT